MTRCILEKIHTSTYIEDESVECNYIEVCESIESTGMSKLGAKKKIVNSDLVYSPATGYRTLMSGAERQRCARGNEAGV